MRRTLGMLSLLCSWPLLMTRSLKHGSPTAADLKRLAAYAKSSANLLTNIIMKNQIDTYGCECIFRTPLDNYNAIVLLHRDKLPHPQYLLFPSEVNQGKHVLRGRASKGFQSFLLPHEIGNIDELKNKLMVNFDPLIYFVTDIENEFPGMFKVWFDSIGGDAIGLICSSRITKKRSRDETGEEDDVAIVDALKDVGQLGKGLVKSVYLVMDPKISS